MDEQLDNAFEALGALAGGRVRELEQSRPPAPLGKLVSANRFSGISQLLPPGAAFSQGEMVALTLALSTAFSPHVMDEAIAGALQSAANHPRIGGVRGRDSRLFLPTLETLMFLLGARRPSERTAVARWFSDNHPFARHGLLTLVSTAAADDAMSAARVVAGEEWVSLIAGNQPRPGPEFPADRIDTPLEWDDLVLDPKTLAEIREIEAWIRHGTTLMNAWGMAKYLKPGYRALFHGPSGTGKTLTASLLGKQTGRDVYRIDLSMVVSKFIGETEKNLARIFAKAEHRDWILFFDEADALFGKRTSVRDAHDRYANQEVSYLLQRVEAFDGLVILASNLRNNIDEAFLRRFQSVVHFPKPTAKERLKIWNRMLPEQARLPDEFNLPALCKRHELTGASIASIIQYASLQALERGESELATRDIELAIAREYEKEGRLG